MKASYWLKKVRRYWKPPLRVLMYHRVAHTDADPWGLAVSPIHFEQQLQVLKRSGLVVSMDNFLENLTTGKSVAPGILLTFDDGYMDNFLAAKPLLEKYELPATFFISTKHIGSETGFWWDELEQILLQEKNLPSKLRINLNGLAYSYNLHGEELLSETLIQLHAAWHYTKEPTTKRLKVYMETWSLLSPLTYVDQQKVLKELRTQCANPIMKRTGYLSMSENQLIEIAQHSLFHIGGHSVTHPALACHSEEIQNFEITQNKEYLEAITGKKVNTFAYPSGSFNESTIRVLRACGFKAAFTTHQQIVTANTKPYELGRFQVDNWNRKKFEKMLSHFTAY